MANVTGWNELMSGNVINAAFTLYDTIFNGWFIAIVFFTFQTTLYIKTRNVTMTWVIGLLFASLYAATPFMNEYTNYVLFISLAFQLASVLFMLFFKR